MRKIRGEINVNIDRRNTDNLARRCSPPFIFVLKKKKIAKKSASNGYKKTSSFSSKISSSVPVPPTTAPAHMGHGGMSKSQEQRPQGHRSLYRGDPLFQHFIPKLAPNSLKPHPQPFS